MSNKIKRPKIYFDTVVTGQLAQIITVLLNIRDAVNMHIRSLTSPIYKYTSLWHCREMWLFNMRKEESPHCIEFVYRPIECVFNFFQLYAIQNGFNPKSMKRGVQRISI